MRTRLLIVLGVFALAAVAAFAFPLLNSTATQRTQQLVIGRNADLDRFATLAQSAIESGDTSALTAEARRYAELYGEDVVVVDAHKVELLETGSLLAASRTAREVIESALRNQPAPAVSTLRPWSTEPAIFARPIGSGTRVTGVVVLQAKVDRAASDIAASWALITAGTILAAAVFAAVALALARWVLRPLHQLEDGVLAVTRGETATVPARAGPRELRALATSFNRMSEAVSAASQGLRDLIANASHQLRNPMMALRMRLDSLEQDVAPDGKVAHKAAIAEVERLETRLEQLLAAALLADSAATRLAESDREHESCNVASVVGERVDFWGAAAQHADIRLEPPECSPQVFVRCPESDLAQVLDVVLDNAIAYAGEGATVHSRCTVDEDSGTGEVVITDDGPGLTPEQLRKATDRYWRGNRDSGRGTGLGLSIAKQLIDAHDGSLELGTNEPHGLVVRIVLPLGTSQAEAESEQP